jgi:hypothetical protein
MVQIDLSRLKCDEAPEEPATVSTENVLKVGMSYFNQTNFMHSGIKGGWRNIRACFHFISFLNRDL